jgi:hypothetical protein
LEHYYYQEALELLFAENPSKKELADALSELSMQYGALYNSATSGHTENAEPELRKIKVVIDFLKSKITHFKEK